MKELRIATSQFPVSDDLEQNKAYMKKHIIDAAKKKADVIHFPETSLSGYNIDPKNINWALLNEASNYIQSLAKKYKINVVFGSCDKIDDTKNPYDCTYVISKEGEVLGKYFKTKLYGKEKERFSSKDNFLIQQIDGVMCGFLICYDSCFPELFDYYRQKGVELIFLSYYNANSSKSKNSMDKLMQAQFITRSTDNLIYISGSNSSTSYSRMPSSFVRPDGEIISLERHRAGILICDYPGKPLAWTYNNND